MHTHYAIMLIYISKLKSYYYECQHPVALGNQIKLKSQSNQHRMLLKILGKLQFTPKHSISPSAFDACSDVSARLSVGLHPKQSSDLCTVLPDTFISRSSPNGYILLLGHQQCSNCQILPIFSFFSFLPFCCAHGTVGYILLKMSLLLYFWIFCLSYQH